VKRLEKPTDLVCEKCGKPMVIRWGRHGSFIACTGYPECSNTRELTVDLPDVDKHVLSELGAEEEYCQNCGRPMTLKKGRFGQFYACTGYPDCKTTKPVGGGEKKPDVVLDEKCPQCGSRLAIKHGRFGEFTSCSNYPKCRYAKQKTIGMACPRADCPGEIAERRSRRGKTFYGCTRYPDCDFTAWSRPVPTKCSQCGHPYLEEKFLKAGSTLQCPNPECRHKEPLKKAS
jgi:DNA topoisomerase-1